MNENGVLELKRHPLSTIFGDITGDVAADFRAGMEHGIEEGGRVVRTLDGMVLDGWQKYRALVDMGVDPEFVPYEGNDPAGFVVKMNVNRRHLTAGQCVMMVTDAHDWANHHYMKLAEPVVEASVGWRGHRGRRGQR